MQAECGGPGLIASLERNTPENTPTFRAKRLTVLFTWPLHSQVIHAYQVRQLVNVQDVGRDHQNGMREPGIDVSDQMDLQAEVPLIAFLRLLHIRDDLCVSSS